MILQVLLFSLLYSAFFVSSHVIDYRTVNGTAIHHPAIHHPAIHPNLPLEVCGTPDPSEELRQTHAYLQSKPGKLLHNRAVAKPINVQVYIHIVATSDQAPYYPTGLRSTMVTNQVAILNTSYAPANISFSLAGSSYTIKDSWATDANSTAMKAALRRGTYSALNIYLQTNLSSPPYTYSAASSLLGYCTLPTNITYTSGGKAYEYPAIDYAQDGCSVLAGSAKGAPFPVQGYDQGKTAVHEVGHWFGLLHTFQDDTCAAGDAGDFVDDTPQESVSTSGCPVGKDSCPGVAGLDPVHNFMDYSTDVCYTSFTPDQQVRMVNMFNLYRKGE